MTEKNAKVDRVLRGDKQWREEFEKLREIALGCQLTEELKWSQACYTLQRKNVVLIHGFKGYFALLFFKGALLKDPRHILATPGQHQAARQIRFTSLREVVQMEPIVKAYILEAIAAERAGLKVALKKTSDLKMPKELQDALDESPALKTAFGSLSPGRQRAYIYHLSQPKKAETREARVLKCAPLILRGKGLND